MAGGIIQTYLILVAIVSISQPSAKNGVCPEDDKAIVERMKERQVTLGQYQLHLEKEIAEVEGRQESLAWPLWQLEGKMPWANTCTVFGLLVPAVLVIWRQRRNGARAWKQSEEEPAILGKVCKGVAFLTKPFLLLRAICIFMGAAVGCLPFFGDRLVEILLKILGRRKKKLVLEIP